MFDKGRFEESVHYTIIWFGFIVILGFMGFVLLELEVLLQTLMVIGAIFVLLLVVYIVLTVKHYLTKE